MKYYVYIIYNDQTLEPIYVGKGKEDRLISHYMFAFNNPHNHLHYKIAKLTNDGNMPKAKLCWQPSEQEAHKLERELIALFGRKDLGNGPLLNLTDGGEGCSGKKWKPESREKLSRTRTGMKRKPFTPEHKAKLAAGLAKNRFKGKAFY